MLDHCDEVGYDILVASATVRQERMYRRVGCKAFGPPLGTPEAPFLAMYLTRELATEPVRRIFGPLTPGEDDKAEDEPNPA